MVVSLPRHGGGHGGRRRGRGGHTFLGCEHNPRLVSNLSNTTLAVLVSRLPPALGQHAILSQIPKQCHHALSAWDTDELNALRAVYVYPSLFCVHDTSASSISLGTSAVC